MTDHDQLLRPYVQRLQTPDLLRWQLLLPLQDFLQLLSLMNEANAKLLPELRDGKTVADDRFVNANDMISRLHSGDLKLDLLRNMLAFHWKCEDRHNAAAALDAELALIGLRIKAGDRDQAEAAMAALLRRRGRAADAETAAKTILAKFTATEPAPEPAAPADSGPVPDAGANASPGSAGGTPSP